MLCDCVVVNRYCNSDKHPMVRLFVVSKWRRGMADLCAGCPPAEDALGDDAKLKRRLAEAIREHPC